MSKPKLIYIISGIEKALEFEWAAKALRDEYDLIFILLVGKKETELYSYLTAFGIKTYFIKYSGKRNLIFSWIKTLFILLKEKPVIVHAHLFDASLIGMTAAYVANVKNRIYTRHHSDYHHVYFPHAVKYDNWINKCATHIIAISNVVRDILVEKENVPTHKISIIHHGLDFNDFNKVNEGSIAGLRKKFGIEKNYPIIGVISRFTKWKGIQYSISAFKNVLLHYPNACLLLINAKGEYKSEIEKLLKEIPEKNYRLIEFESDIINLYKCFTVFVHVPVSPTVEAFGQIYLEALALGIPSVFTKSGIGNEILVNESNALTVAYENSEDIEKAIIRLLTDENLRKKLSNESPQSVRSFSINKKMEAIKAVYSKLLN